MKFLGKVISLAAIATGAAYAINRFVNGAYDKISGKYVTLEDDDYTISPADETNFDNTEKTDAEIQDK